MSQPGATPSDRSNQSPSPTGPADVRRATGPLDEYGLVSLFNEIRDELVSTLQFMLGNADDAQDAAQEAFLKCWRARHTLSEILNLRAWIFRVGLNAAKDVNFIRATKVHCSYGCSGNFAVDGRCAGNYALNARDFGGQHAHVRGRPMG